MVAETLPVDVQQRADAALGAAWRRCENALPEDTSLELVYRSTSGGYVALAQCLPRGVFGPTPTDALEVLAEKLEAL